MPRILLFAIVRVVKPGIHSYRESPDGPTRFRLLDTVIRPAVGFGEAAAAAAVELEIGTGPDAAAGMASSAGTPARDACGCTFAIWKAEPDAAARPAVVVMSGAVAKDGTAAAAKSTAVSAVPPRRATQTAVAPSPGSRSHAATMLTAPSAAHPAERITGGCGPGGGCGGNNNFSLRSSRAGAIIACRPDSTKLPASPTTMPEAAADIGDDTIDTAAPGLAEGRPSGAATASHTCASKSVLCSPSIVKTECAYSVGPRAKAASRGESAWGSRDTQLVPKILALRGASARVRF